MFSRWCRVLLQDVTDLFGTDLPVEGGKGGEFAWRDGPLLAALKAGHWVVLDEVRPPRHHPVILLLPAAHQTDS